MVKRQILTLTVLRQRAGLTQIDLALAVGCSQTQISHWEKDTPIPALKAVAILAVLRATGRGAIPTRLKPNDLGRAWDEVLLERAAVGKAG